MSNHARERNSNGDNLTAVRTPKRIGKKLIATLLTVAMLIGVNTGVFASEVEESGIPHGYVKIASRIEDLGDGITLEKTLAVESSRARVGFSGQRSTMVIHRYFYKGIERLAINVVASFYSVSGQDVCYLGDRRYNITNPGDDEWNFYNVGPKEEPNYYDSSATGGKYYSKYLIEYKIDYLGLLGFPYSNEMWIKCTSDGVLTDSGNSSWSKN